MNSRLPLSLVLLMSTTALACGDDGGDDRDDERTSSPSTPASDARGDKPAASQPDRATMIKQCVDACIKDAATCGADCTGTRCDADCGTDFSSCEKECSEIR